MVCQKVLHPSVLDRLKKCKLAYLFTNSKQDSLEYSTQELRQLILEWITGRYEKIEIQKERVFAWSAFNLMLYINKCVNVTKKQIIILIRSLVTSNPSTLSQVVEGIDQLVDMVIERIGPSLTVIEIDQLLEALSPCTHEFL